MPRSTKSVTAVKAKAKKVIGPAVFSLSAPGAKHVSIAGCFNGWDMGKNPAQKDRKGTWTAKIALPVGTYEYKFVVDGAWITDPANTNLIGNTVGSQNSVIKVR